MFLLNPFDSWGFRLNKCDILDPHRKTFRTMCNLHVSGNFWWAFTGMQSEKTTGNTVPAVWFSSLGFGLSAPWTFITCVRSLRHAFLNFHVIPHLDWNAVFHVKRFLDLHYASSIPGSCCFWILIEFSLHHGARGFEPGLVHFSISFKLCFPHYFILLHIICSTSKNH